MAEDVAVQLALLFRRHRVFLLFSLSNFQITKTKKLYYIHSFPSTSPRHVDDQNQYPHTLNPTYIYILVLFSYIYRLPIPFVFRFLQSVECIQRDYIRLRDYLRIYIYIQRALVTNDGRRRTNSFPTIFLSSLFVLIILLLLCISTCFLRLKGFQRWRHETKLDFLFVTQENDPFRMFLCRPKIVVLFLYSDDVGQLHLFYVYTFIQFLFINISLGIVVGATWLPISIDI